jgi:hypothetical protein
MPDYSISFAESVLGKTQLIERQRGYCVLRWREDKARSSQAALSSP